MARAIVLPDRDILVRVLDHRAPVVVHVQIVRRAEDRDDRGKLFGRGLAVHRVSDQTKRDDQTNVI
jgi:hypothetical protein